MSLKSRLNNWVSKRNAKTDVEERLRRRKEVERQYAKAHPEKIVPVQPEYEQEFKLTHNGKFQLGSNGKLTREGLIHRLKYRLNIAIAVLVILIIILYLYFIFL
ncbi:MAG: hypothetical protein ABF703_04455 [Oenococcus sp.]|uniref:hypothetical protein n=1 Tax=Oenococcus TaxID=46254 RepID=UPI0021E93558|nr:hypothetical protein [Oenococcus kitaharae]MCV3295892.1 hypothetical protein [Oenococcus kitaharae]